MAYQPQESDYRRIPGGSRRYENTVTGESVSYHQYLKVKYGGYSSHQLSALRKESSDLVRAYKKTNGGYAGMKLAVENLKRAAKGREKRLALVPFYPEAEDADDDRYL